MKHDFQCKKNVCSLILCGQKSIVLCGWLEIECIVALQYQLNVALNGKPKKYYLHISMNSRNKLIIVSKKWTKIFYIAIVVISAISLVSTTGSVIQHFLVFVSKIFIAHYLLEIPSLSQTKQKTKISKKAYQRIPSDFTTTGMFATSSTVSFIWMKRLSHLKRN